MRILTLNTHSLIEPDYERKLEKFVRGVGEMKPHVIALQEVNQSKSACIVNGEFRVRCDNHILRVREMLKKRGIDYSYVWRGMKESYGMFEEGLGVLVEGNIDDVDFVALTPPRNDWKMRYALGVRTGETWFYSVHTGRWDDNEVSFMSQIEKLQMAVAGKNAIIMGDFNCPDRCTGYKVLEETMWQDIWATSPVRCGCATAKSSIDGWSEGEEMMRIDYIFANFAVDVSECRVVFTKQDYGVVSDHFGVYAVGKFFP